MRSTICFPVQACAPRVDGGPTAVRDGEHAVLRDGRNLISRLRHDLRLAIITMLGSVTAVVLVSFLVWRLTRGEWVAAAMDAAVVVTLTIILRRVWRGQYTERAGGWLVAINSGFAGLACVTIGAAAHGWVYLVLMTNFYLAPIRVAAWSGLGLLWVASVTLLREAGPHQLSTLVTWALVFGFAHTFARRTRQYGDSLELLASLDPLTRIPNRGMLEADLRHAIATGQAGRMGLLVLDIDRFKAVNDTYGHAAGDVVLIELAALLDEELRQGDSVYRFGGEEFVMLLPIGSEDALSCAGERVRAAVSSRLAAPGGPVTVAVGGAMLSTERDWQDWFGRADAALYLAKRDGGDVVRIAKPL
ncbi:GGDEF domain-containing protein [Luteimonas chenhongjianii]|uniref:diguanylate cyclase n=2 Tax=Lysobacteraceae TaxID=32033 RepID=A0A290XE12_9GAMM|nr:GGDEF domain-containing protein [Luteimonas chenhongjianii]RPD86564.1 GGDEF domain-containing protein [Luteimonas sp. 100069]